MTDELLRVEHVTKNYGKNTANHDISFAVNAGETAVLLAPTARARARLSSASRASCASRAISSSRASRTSLSPPKRRLGYIPEMPAVYELLTVAEHLEFIRRGLAHGRRRYGDALLERLELADKRGKLGRELSKGMQQKLSIACAMVHRPDVLIFDEPLVGLDPHAIKELKAIFRELRAEGPRRAHLHAHDRLRRGLLGCCAHHDERASSPRPGAPARPAAATSRSSSSP